MAARQKSRAPAEVSSAEALFEPSQKQFDQMREAILNLRVNLPLVAGAGAFGNWLDSWLSPHSSLWRETAEKNGYCYIPATNPVLVNALMAALRQVPGLSVEPQPNEFNRPEFYNLHFKLSEKGLQALQELTANSNPLADASVLLSLTPRIDETTQKHFASLARQKELDQESSTPGRLFVSAPSSTTRVPMRQPLPEEGTLSSDLSQSPSPASPAIALRARELSQIMAEFILPYGEVQSLPKTELGSYIRSQRKAWQLRTESSLGVILQYSNGQVPVQWVPNLVETGNAEEGPIRYGFIQPVRLKAGITWDGKPSLLIDRETFARLQSGDGRSGWHGQIGNAIIVQEPENGQLPDGFCLIAEGQSMAGIFSWKVKLNSDNPSSILPPVFGPLRQHYSYLEQQSRKSAGSDPEFEYTAVRCGRLSPSTSDCPAPLRDRAIALASDGRAPNHSVTSIESVGFFSFSSYHMERHNWVFFHSPAESESYAVVDAQTGVRGIGESREKAIDDLVHNGYSPSGVYYYFPKSTQSFQSAHHTSPAEYVTSGQEKWWHSVLDSFSALQSAYLVPTPVTDAVGALGTIAEMAENELDREKRIRALGHSFSWNSGEGSAMLANAALAAGTAFIPGLKALKAAKAVKATEVGLMGGFLGANFMSHLQIHSHLVEEQVESSGQTMVNRQGVPSDWQHLLDRMFPQLYLWANEKPKIDFDHLDSQPDSEKKRATQVLESIKNEWMPILNQASAQTTPYGSPLPMGISPQEMPDLWIARMARNSDWINSHQTDVQRMSALAGLDLESTVLLILASGGPLIEGSLENTLLLIRSEPSSFLADAASHLSSQGRSSAQSFGMPPLAPSEYRQQLAGLWLTGKISTSQLDESAKAGRP